MCQVDTKSHAGAKYFVTFIDDHSRRMWATLLKTKDQVLSFFKELHIRVERESGRKLKAVRVDNGGEYRGQFEEYCRSKGIRLEFTVPKTFRTKRASREDEPDHNGEGSEYASTCQATQDVLG